jgi:hypothetical protein
MISLPTSGFNVSTTQHNSNLMVAADWVELSCLLSGEPVSGPIVVDILDEGGIYSDQGFATEFVESVFGEIRRRGLPHKATYALRVEADAVLPFFRCPTL